MHEKQKRNNPETQIKNSILGWLNLQRDCMAWPNDSVGIYDPTKKRFRKKHSQFHRNGVADILGIWRGRPLAVEVKSERGRLSENQKDFLEVFKGCGGIAIVARSIEDVEAELR